LVLVICAHPLIVAPLPYTTLFRSKCLAEAIAGVQAPQLLHVRLTQGKLVVAHIQWHVQADRGELAVERQAVERRAQVLADLPLRSEEHTSELQSRENLVCRLLLEK